MGEIYVAHDRIQKMATALLLARTVGVAQVS